MNANELKIDAIITGNGGDFAGEVHIIADDGTDLHLKVPNAKRAEIRTKGFDGKLVTSLSKGWGVYVLNPGDFLTSPLNEVIEKIQLLIRENRIVEISGGVQAKTLEKVLRDTDDPKAFNLAEFAIGIKSAKPKKTQCSIVTEKLVGGIHIAAIKFGASVFFKPETTGQWLTILRKGSLMV